MTRQRLILSAALLPCVLVLPLLMVSQQQDSQSIQLQHEDQQRLTVTINGDKAFTYEHGPVWAIPHYLLHSPSGKELTVQQTQPFPHHRSVWIADKVKMGDLPMVDFYHSTNNMKQRGNPEAGYHHYIKNVGIVEKPRTDRATGFQVNHRWLVHGEHPVLDEQHDVTVHDLGDGQYLMDLSFKLTASYGDVRFTSDWVHYAWPYVRIHPQFNAEAGGVLTDDQGRTGQAQTHGQNARWMCFTNTIDGETEGLAIFVHPDGGTENPRWLTRDYGTFGPRRAPQYDGRNFTLEKGESLRGRVGILVHRGDVETARVAQRFEQYVTGELE